MSRARPGILIVSFLLFCLDLQAQNTATIIGQIRLPDGGPPPQRVLVSLETRGILVTTTFADNEGKFAFPHLIANLYHVTINDSGYYPFHQTVSVVPTITSTNHVRLVLRPRGKTAATAPPGVAAGGNPNLVDTSELLRKYPKQAVKEFENGVKADQQGKPDRAIGHYQKALEIAPDFYPARNNLGSKYAASGDFAAAEKEFQRVIELNPADAQAYFNMGNVFLLTRRNPEALGIIQEGLRREPNSAFGQFLLGSAYGRAGQFAEAESALRRAIELDPTMSRVRIELAGLFLQQQKKAQAVAELKTFAKEFPADPLLPKVKELLQKLESQPM